MAKGFTKTSGISFQIERTLEGVLNRRATCGLSPDEIKKLRDTVLSFPTQDVRVVVFGGGTGLSTVVGGNPQRDDWYEKPNVGLKTAFPNLDVVVCTTDDGGSTGELLKHVPMIGIGDIRKLCLSMIVPENLRKRYGIRASQCQNFFRFIQTVFNYRFSNSEADIQILRNPMLAAPSALRCICPKPLRELLKTLGRFMAPEGRDPRIPISDHCLGNLLLTASIFMKSGTGFERQPSTAALREGIDYVADAIGSIPGKLHPATATPGQLIFHYANGIAICGQSKALKLRRGFPVYRVYTQFSDPPEVAHEVIEAVRAADVIIIAPGSLYTSSIPVLQVPGIAEAIRENRQALKILGANFWIEEGETDITQTDKRRGFRVSELCEAYDRNVPGGRAGLFTFVISANLDNMPATILRNYTLEGKRPIYLDRERVAALHVYPIEATVFSREHARSLGVVQHDPEQFTLAVRTLLYVWHHMKRPVMRKRNLVPVPDQKVVSSKLPLCGFWREMKTVIAQKDCTPDMLKDVLSELVWKNRDIRKEHLGFFSAIKAVDEVAWSRSIAWDNVLGYYDPLKNMIVLHKRLFDDHDRLQGNILIALGESLLGNYIRNRRWVHSPANREWGVRRFEITLQEKEDLYSFLTLRQLHEYLILARMVPHPKKRNVYSITLNNNEGFLPPGLLFGLMYAWYLDNALSPIMENEMLILSVPERDLIPHQAQEYQRKKRLIDFFRKEVFGYSM